MKESDASDARESGRSWSDTVTTASLVVVATCLVLLTVTLIHRNAWRTASLSAGSVISQPSRVNDWRTIAAAGTVIGSPKAPVTLVEFSDYQCPFCAEAESTLWRRYQSAAGNLALSFHDLPLVAIHPLALKAAIGAARANEQGRFVAYRHRVFAEQANIGITDWDGFAKEAGVADARAFDVCMQRHAAQPRISADVALARKLGVNGTPAFMVNGVLYPPAEPLAIVLAALDSALRDAATN